MTRQACLIFARGCSRSQVDLIRLRAYLEVNAWAVTSRVQDADLLVVSACAFTAHEQKTSEAYLGSLNRRKRENAPLVIVGCLAGIDPEVAKGLGAIGLKTEGQDALDRLIDATVPLATIPDQNLVQSRVEEAKDSLLCRDHLYATMAGRAEIPLQVLMTVRRWARFEPSPPDADLGEPFHIRVARGCASECSYCAIRIGAGPIRSKPLKDILEEFRAGLTAGCRLFNLVAEDVGAYGRDVGLSVVDLLETLLGQPGDFRVTWADFGPRWLIEELTDIERLVSLHSDKMGAVGFPIQSGSERILPLMNRGYTAADAKRSLLALRRAAPNLQIGTHIIVGFPGETRGDFLDSCEFVRSIGFSRVMPFTYSERPGTEAARLPGALPYATKAWRTWELRTRLRLKQPGKAQGDPDGTK